ncbi:Nicalin-1-like protein [Leptotrombidium deliense]|uniref:Nicalin-1-like protein n=1 Tax=Leptotrombidium deliense TaxID=299467 RepID=A0A443SRZ1_9ACAR|nr:Nicalin-1-like protein [Leptotrombidium deliense]
MFAYSEAEHILNSSQSTSLPAFFAMLTIIPILIAISSAPMAVKASQELTVYRMQEYDFQSSTHGCRNSIMNLEARTPQLLSQSFARKCVIVKLMHLVENRDLLDELFSETVAGGLLILIPANLKQLTEEQEANLLLMEKTIISETVQIPVYFATETKELLQIYDEVEQSGYTKHENVSGSEKLFNAVVANGYQIVVSGSQAAAIPNTIISSLEGKLVAKGLEDQSPTIAITAYYDSSSSVPGLSFGGDSNGSGVVALLELSRILSKIYSNQKTHPPFNVVFLLSGGGKYSYLGTKKWIEDHLDNSESGVLSDLVFSICLEALADVEGTNSLYMHVSKPPKENTPAFNFFQQLQKVGKKYKVNVTMVHKKINLADENLAWEHERFSIRRLPAFTLSTLNSHKSLRRSSITDTYEKINTKKLTRNINLIAEAFSRQMFDVEEKVNSQILHSELAVSESFISSSLKFVTSIPRAQQLLLTTERASSYQLPTFLSTLQVMLKRYLKEVSVYHYKPDKREPEVVFYEPTVTKMNAYNIKPAIFDLFLSVVIVTYFGLLYVCLIVSYQLICNASQHFYCRTSITYNHL